MQQTDPRKFDLLPRPPPLPSLDSTFRFPFEQGNTVKTQLKVAKWSVKPIQDIGLQMFDSQSVNQL